MPRNRTGSQLLRSWPTSSAPTSSACRTIPTSAGSWTRGPCSWPWRTKNAQVFPDVSNLPLRPPNVLAKAAASLDLLSGRAELELGATHLIGDSGDDPEGMMRRFAKEVAPRVRESIVKAWA